MSDFHNIVRHFWRVGLVLLPFIGCFGCSRDSVRVSGVVHRISGNQMPSPDLPPSVPRGYRTTVYFFEPAQRSQAKQADRDGIFFAIGTRLAGKVETKDNGEFLIRLKPGRYSVLIGKDTLYYGNISDGKGFINPVEVKAGEKNRLELRADWDASY
jgi:hypothetical protein